MLVALTEPEILQIQARYRHLINYEDEDPESPIDPASYVDSNGDALLHIAATCGDNETVALLLRSGVDANGQGDMGCTPLHYAVMNHHDEVVRILVAAGARTDIENDFGKSPLES